MEEFYLRDYIKILWQRKWVVVLVTFVVVLLSVLYSYAQPTQYRAEAQVLWQDPTNFSFLFPDSNIERSEILSAVRGLELMTDVDVLELLRAYSDSTSKLTASISSQTIAIEVTGTDQPSMLEAKLSDHIDHVTGLAEREVAQVFEMLRDMYERGLQLFEAERDELVTRIKNSKESYLATLVEYQHELTAIVNSAPEGEKAALLVGMSNVALEISKLRSEIESGQFTSGVGSEVQLADLERLILVYQLSVEEAATLSEADFQPLRVTQKATASSAPLVRLGYFVLILALTLGLMLGVLTSFFLHFVRSE